MWIIFLYNFISCIVPSENFPMVWFVGILSPVNHIGLHQGWTHCSICLLFTLHASHQTTNYPKTTKSILTHITTKDYIRAEHKLHSTSEFFFFTSHHTASHVFWAYLHSVGTQHGSLHPAGWPILFCGPTQELVLATANAGKTQRFWKKCRWMDWKSMGNGGCSHFVSRGKLAATIVLYNLIK